jgi:hypothetical protein
MGGVCVLAQPYLTIGSQGCRKKTSVGGSKVWGELG